MTIAALSAMSVLRRPLLRSCGAASNHGGYPAARAARADPADDRCRPGALAVATAGCGSSRRQLVGLPAAAPPDGHARRTSPRPGHDAPGSRRPTAAEGPILAPARQPAAQRRDAEPLRLRALRHGAQAAHRRPGRRSTPRAATARACAARSSPATSRWPSSPPFESQTTAGRPRRRQGVYVADLPLREARQAGRHRAGAARRPPRAHERLLRAASAPRAPSRPARVGQGASASTRRRSPTSAATPRRSTRACPPATDLLKTDFADVLGKKPVVLTFATPLLCQSRVCGPVVDVVEQVQVRDEGRRRLHPPGDLQGQQGQQGRDAAGRRLAAAVRALDLRHRPQRRRRARASRARSRSASCSARSPRSPGQSS